MQTHWIDNRPFLADVPADGDPGRSIDVVNPATETRIDSIPAGSAAAADAAVGAARRAFDGWAALSPGARREHLVRAAARIDRHLDRIAALLTAEMGKTLARRRGVDRALELSGDGRRRECRREPGRPRAT